MYLLVFRLPTLACAYLPLLGQLPLDKGIVTCHGFRSVISYAENQNPKLCSLVKKVQNVKLLIDFGTMFWTAGRLIDSLGKKYQLFQVIHDYYWSSNLVGWGLLFGAGFIAVKSVKLVNRFFSNEVLKELEEADEGITIDCGKSTNRLGQQIWTLIGAISNVSLAVFSTSPYFYAICAVLQGITFLNQAKEKWIQQSINIDCRARVGALADVRTIDFSHYFRVFDKKSNPEEKFKCAVCLGDEIPPNIYFCGSHVYHKECAVRAIKSKNQTTIDSARVEYKYVRASDEKYTFTLNRENVSPCPECRQPPVDHDLEFNVTTISGRGVLAEIKYA